MFLEPNKEQWIRLSHVLGPSTPAYGGADGLLVQTSRDMSRGDSSNSVLLTLSNHLGSHVDAPRHFVADGQTVDSYPIEDWLFWRPWVADVELQSGERVEPDRVEAALATCVDADLLLLRTGNERRRGRPAYWSDSPAFVPELAAYLQKRLPSLKAIGFDTISLSSYQNRELGRLAHRAFLGRNLRIFEDLSLLHAPARSGLSLVIALPLLFERADGAPCTVAGRVKA